MAAITDTNKPDAKTDSRAKDFPGQDFPLPQPNVFKSFGVQVSALVSELSSYTKDGQTKHNVHLFIPGNPILKVGLDGPPDPTRYIPGLPIDMKILVRDYKGMIFFTEALD